MINADPSTEADVEEGWTVVTRRPGPVERQARLPPIVPEDLVLGVLSGGTLDPEATAVALVARFGTETTLGTAEELGRALTGSSQCRALLSAGWAVESVDRCQCTIQVQYAPVYQYQDVTLASRKAANVRLVRETAVAEEKRRLRRRDRKRSKKLAQALFV